MFWLLRLCTKRCVVPSPAPRTVADGMVAVSATFVDRRLGVHGVHCPSTPGAPSKYSAAVRLPPAAVSSPVALSVTLPVPLAGCGVATPATVFGPVLGR